MSRHCLRNSCPTESELSSLGSRRKGSRVERRVIALRLIASGKMAKDIAPAVGVTEESVREWVKEYSLLGVDSLRYDTKKGSKPRLSPEREKEIVDAFKQALPSELKIGVWCGWALRSWIRDRYGVE